MDTSPAPCVSTDAPPSASGRVLWLSTTAFTLLFAVWLMFGVLGVALKDELHLDPVRFAWLTALPVLSGSLGRLPLGLLADRFGGRRLMVALLLWTAGASLLIAHTSSFAALILGALLVGVAGNAFAVGIAWNAAWFPREKQGLALGTFGAGNVGASVTKLIGPTLIAAIPAGGLLGGLLPGGWRFVPVLYAALSLGMAALLWRAAPASDRRPGRGRPLASLLAPLRVVRVWRFGLYYVVVFGAYVALSLWLPNYYRSVYGLSLGKAGLLTALFIFPASLLRPVGGWLSDRLGARPVTYAVFALMALACLPLALPRAVFSFEPGVGTFFVCVELLGVGMGLGKASVYKYIPDYFPRDVGAVGGLVGTLGALGGFLLPLAFGYLARSTNVPQSCFSVLLALVLVSFLWLHLVVVGLRGRPSGSAPLPKSHGNP